MLVVILRDPFANLTGSGANDRIGMRMAARSDSLNGTWRDPLDRNDSMVAR